MKTTIGDNDPEGLREAHVRAMRAHLTAQMTEAMMVKARTTGGMIATEQLRRMCAAFAEVCADTMLAELAVIHSMIMVSPATLPAGLRGATTQAIIDQHARPALAKAMAEAMLTAGCAETVLSMATSGLTVEFHGYGFVMKHATGPVSKLPAGEALGYPNASVNHALDKIFDTPRDTRTPLMPFGGFLGRDGAGR